MPSSVGSEIDDTLYTSHPKTGVLLLPQLYCRGQKYSKEDFGSTIEILRVASKSALSHGFGYIAKVW
ncbi:hypothetical protein LOAG_02069 [Loa loa]|uniref:Uncharacterized protein n=1 Tax=Loa loa TaxID=7209 RepID=A0A1S0U790_LOALO|nr:hypothetical protein LOAG_02069 [Loa loa]EFO26410.1 hypothetical protein LOAG_02069 [Loa loa]